MDTARFRALFRAVIYASLAAAIFDFFVSSLYALASSQAVVNCSPNVSARTLNEDSISVFRVRYLRVSFSLRYGVALHHPGFQYTPNSSARSFQSLTRPR